ncbi:MAG: hypothetical protein KF754_11975 [Planctomycetes bacterium]|nr:hypothetical protein [Planctomycetota bacterium]
MSMHRSWAAALGFAVSACAIAGISLLVATPAHSDRASAAQLPATPTPVLLSAPEEEAPAPISPDQKGMEESPVPYACATPSDLINGTLSAIERNDTAWLARAMESCASKPMLVEVDTLDAHRQFLWRSIAPRWNRVRAAWDERSYEIIETGDTAEIHAHVGGALGTDVLKLVRIGGNWRFSGF